MNKSLKCEAWCTSMKVSCYLHVSYLRGRGMRLFSGNTNSFMLVSTQYTFKYWEKYSRAAHRFRFSKTCVFWAHAARSQFSREICDQHGLSTRIEDSDSQYLLYARAPYISSSTLSACLDQTKLSYFFTRAPLCQDLVFRASSFSRTYLLVCFCIFHFSSDSPNLTFYFSILILFLVSVPPHVVCQFYQFHDFNPFR